MTRKSIDREIENAILFKSLDEIRKAIAQEKEKLKNKRPPFNSPIAHSIKYCEAAIKRGDEEIFRYLVSENLALFDVDRSYAGHYNGAELTNALHLAALSGQAAIFKLLLVECKINPALSDSHGKTVLHYVKASNCHKDIKKYMTEILELMQDYHKTGNNSKKIEAAHLYFDENKLPFKSNRVIPESVTNYIYNPQAKSSAATWVDVCEKINKKYEDLQKKKTAIDKRRDDFLNNALEGRLTEAEIIQFKEFYGTINVTTGYNSGNKTALHLAAENGHLECVTFLLKHSSNIDMVDSDGKNAYELASEKFKTLNNPAHKETYRKIAVMIENAGRKNPSATVNKPQAKELNNQPHEIEV